MDATACSGDAWLQRLGTINVPVLRATRHDLNYWKDHSDRADANLLADIVLRDPLMALKVLVQVAQTLGPRLRTPARTVTAALVLTGIEPFFRNFTGVLTLEDRLEHWPAALAGALAAVHRSRNAARLAAAFAIHRQDEDVELLHHAALLQNFAGLLLWCDAPLLAMEILRRQREDPTLRSAQAQREVLGVELGQLALRLMERWAVPASLCELAHGGQAARPGPRTVRLAVQIARHLETGWHNPALPDDFAELGALLNVTPAAAASLVRDVAL